MRTEESKIRWAIEREVKYRQQMEEQERMKQELSYNQREVTVLAILALSATAGGKETARVVEGVF
jgi:hypothetical protein